MNNTLHQYKSSAELKALAKEHLFGKYGTVIGAVVVANMIVQFITFSCTALIDQTTLAGVILNFVITFIIAVLNGLFTSGTTYLFLKLSCDRPVMVSDVFYGFKLFPNKALLIQLYLAFWTYLVGLLPGTILSYFVEKNPKDYVLLLAYSLTSIFGGVIMIIVSLIYSQAFFLLHDFPNYSVQELLSLSRKLMKGSKGRLFYLIVSFIPLILLGLLSCGIAYLWLAPYISATQAEFFLDLIRNSETRQ